MAKRGFRGEAAERERVEAGRGQHGARLDRSDGVGRAVVSLTEMDPEETRSIEDLSYFVPHVTRSKE
jgi:hypothetical protein